jgi:hypothetical protein
MTGTDEHKMLTVVTLALFMYVMERMGLHEYAFQHMDADKEMLTRVFGPKWKIE